MKIVSIQFNALSHNNKKNIIWFFFHTILTTIHKVIWSFKVVCQSQFAAADDDDANSNVLTR